MIPTMHTFSIRDIFLNFDQKCLQISNSEALKHGVNNRRALAMEVFKKALTIVVDDIIDNGTQFKFSCTGQGKYYLTLRRVTGELFNWRRKNNGLKLFDPVETDFNAYDICFYIERKGSTTYSVPVHIDKKRTVRIAELTKAHKIKAGVVKVYSDYYPQVMEAFPYLSKNDVYRCMRYGFDTFRRHLCYGGDIRIGGPGSDLYIQTGKIYTNEALMIQYALKKMKIKIRVMYRRMKLLWDGWVYFSISMPRLLKLWKPIVNHETVDFGDCIIHKCYDDAFVSAYERPVLFRMRWDENDFDTDFTAKRRIVTDKAELVEVYQYWYDYDIISLKHRTYQTLFSFDECRSVRKKMLDNENPHRNELRKKRREKKRQTTGR